MVAKWCPKRITLLAGEPPKTLQKRSKIASATQPRLFIDFAWISVACGNGSAPGPMEVGLHVMVCDVHLCLRRKGLGDLGRNWLDAGDERIEKNIVQVCFCEGVMLSTACDVVHAVDCSEGSDSENRFESRRGKRVIKLLTRTRNTLVTAKDGI